MIIAEDKGIRSESRAPREAKEIKALNVFDVFLTDYLEKIKAPPTVSRHLTLHGVKKRNHRRSQHWLGQDGNFFNYALMVTDKEIQPKAESSTILQSDTRRASKSTTRKSSVPSALVHPMCSFRNGKVCALNYWQTSPRNPTGLESHKSMVTKPQRHRKKRDRHWLLLARITGRS